jgi:hypothetical protein
VNRDVDVLVGAVVAGDHDRIPGERHGERGIDSHQMAKTLEVSERTIRNWEADRTHPPKAVRAVYHWETGVPLSWIEGRGPSGGGGEPSGGEAVTIGYPTRAPVRLLQLAA